MGRSGAGLLLKVLSLLLAFAYARLFRLVALRVQACSSSGLHQVFGIKGRSTHQDFTDF